MLQLVHGHPHGVRVDSWSGVLFQLVKVYQAAGFDHLLVDVDFSPLVCGVAACDSCTYLNVT